MTSIFIFAEINADKEKKKEENQKKKELGLIPKILRLVQGKGNITLHYATNLYKVT